MKVSPFFQKAYRNMKPGVITQAGFLGDDPRPLPDIIHEDEGMVAALGLDYDEMTERMKRLMDEGRKGLGDPIEVEGRWLVTVYEARGLMPSPFEDGVFHKTNALVRSMKSGRSINYSELSLHLIARHHFFQGRGSPYRLEPRDIKDVLEL